MVILDLQKAFDTVNHKILTSKLRAMGVSQAAVNWFISYLGGRVQAVEISGVFQSLGLLHVVFHRDQYLDLFYF